MNQGALPQADHDHRVLVEILLKHPLTHGLTQHDVGCLTTFFRLKSIPAYTTIIQEGSSPHSVYLIVSGGVRVFITTLEGKEVTLSFLGSNEILGELAYLDQAPRSANVQTFKDTQMLVVCGDDFHKMIERHPIVAMNLLNVLAKRIRHMHQQLKDFIASSLLDRTFKTLSVLGKCFPEGEITLSHEDLAVILGATRPRVTEALQSLKKSKKLGLSRQKMRFPSAFPEEQT